jgi:hypothetical protein
VYIRVRSNGRALSLYYQARSSRLFTYLHGFKCARIRTGAASEKLNFLYFYKVDLGRSVLQDGKSGQ